ncbi:hypothetical protein [Sediminibacillus massiliensis]|uniref:hypothetical protein n=1 Tax=Sediminibacillus massiliensis TaxID=1926277 RepID=UPI0009883171|nr:hypothetical protein [Sediminibacillus massiliensis]
MENLLHRSKDTKQIIEIIYIADDDQLSQRSIRVIAVKEKSILAYCYSRKKIRTFKQDNILAVFPAKKSRKQGA